MSNLSPELRAQLLAALAGWFEKPELSSVELAPENRLLCALGSASRASVSGTFSDLFNRLWEIAQSCDSESAFHELELEHARLFLTPSKARIAPYEHTYSRCVVSDLDFELQEVYRSGGLQVGPAIRELTDHISIELEFMARLLATANELKAKKFFVAHLSSFHPRCANELRERTRNPFYSLVADTLSVCAELESQMLNATPSC